MGTNLVLARVGANSLHPAWYEGDGGRDWDLRLVPYQPLPEAAHVGCEVGEIVPGPKWTGLRKALHAWDGWRDYDYIWLPDDDILATQESINRMFEIARTLGLDLFAPALDRTSYFAHFSTMRNVSFYGRYVGFVEIMVPGFSRRALEKLLFTLDLSETGWGWGLDSVWPSLLEYRNVAVLDGVTVQHTRPVGEMRDLRLRQRVLAESERLLSTFSCHQRHVTFAAFGEDLKRLDLSPEGLLAELTRGWEYLIDQDPRILAWIAQFQLSALPSQEYPVQGTPDRGRVREPC
ncbi:MAG TPA: hypothetical protein VLP43_05740 [Solirubrobacteraceae bacterium]|nr:hypothetical protein [Solirubrobacteraceae bacterium]